MRTKREQAVPADESVIEPYWPSEVEIDEVIAECGGDVRRALAVLLHDLAVFAADYEADVSHGFVRRFRAQ